MGRSRLRCFQKYKKNPNKLKVLAVRPRLAPFCAIGLFILPRGLYLFVPKSTSSTFHRESNVSIGEILRPPFLSSGSLLPSPGGPERPAAGPPGDGRLKSTRPEACARLVCMCQGPEEGVCVWAGVVVGRGRGHFRSSQRSHPSGR